MQEKFFISEGIDGSATNYTIMYNDSTSGRMCDFVTISASVCSGQCNHTFDVPSICFAIASITITVFATNILGDGPMTLSVLEISECIYGLASNAVIILYACYYCPYARQKLHARSKHPSTRHSASHSLFNSGR